MTRLTLTPEHSAQLQPLIAAAYLTGGAVFCQARRCQPPNHDTVAVDCHLVSGAGAGLLRKWLTENAPRLRPTGEELL